MKSSSQWYFQKKRASTTRERDDDNDNDDHEHNDYDDDTAMVAITVCHALRRKHPPPSSPPTVSSFSAQHHPCSARRVKPQGYKYPFRNSMTVKFLCHSSVALMLYNLLGLIMVLYYQETYKRFLTQYHHSPPHEPEIVREVHPLLVQQTAFTNLLPPSSSSLSTEKTRRRKNTKESSSSQPMTLNLYDIYRDAEEVSGRSIRFPTMEQRLKVYLSTWYIPPCPNTGRHHKVQYNYDKHNNHKQNSMMVIFQPLHMNDTRSTISSTKTSLAFPSSGDLVSKQPQLRQLRAKTNNKARKKNAKTPLVSSSDNSNDAMMIPHPLIYTVDTTVSHERHLLLYSPNVMEQCHDPFCTDVVQFIQPSLNRTLLSTASSSQPVTATQQRQPQTYSELPNVDKFPILFQFGDAELYRSYVPARKMDIYSPMVPVLRKYRYSMTPSDLQQVTSGRVTTDSNDDKPPEPLQCYSSEEKRIVAGTVRNPVPKTQAIISIVSNYPRHFEPLNHVNDADIAWEKKFNMAVYRGALTGRNKADYKSSDLKFCVQVPRCNLVYQLGNSSLVDAMMVPYGKMNYPLSDPLNGVKMFGHPMSMEEMLKYKAIVMLEGNDVSSGLKWALFSNSVVLTQAPTCTSWAMEELLVPWVHYIPINDDLSDVEEKVQWILDHDDEARTIARNGRLWIADLVYHPDADKENEMILDETMRRYRSHFEYNPSLEAK